MAKFYLFLLFLLLVTQAYGQPSIYWQDIASKDVIHATSISSRTSNKRLVRADFISLNEYLLSKKTFYDVMLPLPNGKTVLFRLTKSSVIALSLQERFPAIQTYRGFQLNKPDNQGRFDISPYGFHGMFLFEGDTVFIEPANIGNKHHYVSYFKSDAELPDKHIMKQLPPKRHAMQHFTDSSNKKEKSFSDAKLRTYRIAIAATGEYTQFHQGTKTSGLAAIITLVNRLNDLFQRDLGIKLELVANNDVIIYTDADTDPFNNNHSDGELNPAVINQAIGASNYDIGHVVNRRSGGIAFLGAVCYDDIKADAYSGDSNPIGDAFHVHFVAHEIGHQFGAQHTFNGCEGSLNRVKESAYEPGSGSTVMGYTGSCGEQDLQTEKDPYFHARSIEEIRNYVTSDNGNTCGTDLDVNNSFPLVSGGKDYIIPSRTPFVLKGSAIDPDTGDQLTYSWEQYDLGARSASLSDQVDDGSRPLFRVWPPSSSPIRYFPRLSDVLAGITVKGETYATTTRDLNFRLVVRDNESGVSSDDIKIKVIDNGEAFKVLSPSGGEVWSTESQLITWQLAKTHEHPINCTSVNIHLSTNNGDSFKHILASEISNSGSAEVSIPNVSTINARVKISCADNIFYTVNFDSIYIDLDGSNNMLYITGQQTITIEEDTSLLLNKDLFSFNQTGDITIQLIEGDNYSLNGNELTPIENFNGELAIQVKAKYGALESQLFNATVTVTPLNDVPIATEDNYSVQQNSSNNNFNVLANDSDPDQNDTLILDSVNYQGDGTISIVNNQLLYSPKVDFSGTESFIYTVKDNQNSIHTATVSVSVAVLRANNNEQNTSKSGGASFSILLLLVGLLSLRSKTDE